MKRVFSSVEQSTVLLWTGNPDCQAAHNEILKFLETNCKPFPANVIEEDNILRGNLGETITFCLGKTERFRACIGHFANALRPFSGKSNPELDLLWVHFGERPSDDWAMLQEVKTTSADSIDYAKNLTDDYDKLFGTNPRLTLHTRIQDFKNRLEFEHNKPRNILKRANQLAGTEPANCRRIRLLPTAVHDLTANDAAETMLVVRETLTARGWQNVEAWAIGLSSLDNRIVRLAKGRR